MIWGLLVLDVLSVGFSQCLDVQNADSLVTHTNAKTVGLLALNILYEKHILGR